MFVVATISGMDAAVEPTRMYSRRVATTNAERPDVLPKKYEPAFVRANFLLSREHDFGTYHGDTP